MIDKTTIEECKNGNLQSFKKLVIGSSPYAFTIAFRMMGDESQASDIVQESMVTVWKTIHKLKLAESYKSWLSRIVVNKCYDELRKRKKNPEVKLDEKAWEFISEKIIENPSSELENREMASIISALMEKLSPKQKLVFVLSDLEEMSNEEICKITSMSKTNLKANLYYARKRIGEMIEKHLDYVGRK